MTAALAIFVKTPGHSPIKTRLAASLGAPAAIAFHRLAAQAVAETAQAACAHAPMLQAYWAVAENAALDDPLWRNLPQLWQGEGSLGERLHRVYATLLVRHERVLLVGVDAPQLTQELLLQACDALTDAATPCVIGEAHDGGFWLFGGRVPIAHEIWCGVRYSCADTARQLRAALRPLGAPASLPTLTDIDHAHDLPALAAALDTLPALLPAQQAVRRWLRALPAVAPRMQVLA